MQPQKNNVAQPSNVLIDARTYTQDASGKGVVLGTEDTSWLNGRAQQNQGSLRPMSGGVDAPPPQGAQAAMNEQLQNLFSGENLSEDFMGKASIVFEAALNERTEAIRQSVLSESAALVEQAVFVQKFPKALSMVSSPCLKHTTLKFQKASKIFLKTCSLTTKNWKPVSTSRFKRICVSSKN